MGGIPWEGKSKGYTSISIWTIWTYQHDYDSVYVIITKEKCYTHAILGNSVLIYLYSSQAVLCYFPVKTVFSYTKIFFEVKSVVIPNNNEGDKWHFQTRVSFNNLRTSTWLCYTAYRLPYAMHANENRCQLLLSF